LGYKIDGSYHLLSISADNIPDAISNDPQILETALGNIQPCITHTAGVGEVDRVALDIEYRMISYAKKKSM